MSFSTISYWVQHALAFALFGSVALAALFLLVVGGGRLFQLRHAAHAPKS